MRPGDDRALLAGSFPIGRGAHEAERFVALARGEGDPGSGAETLHLDLAGPVVVLRRIEGGGDGREPNDVLLRRGGIAAARGADGAREQRHRLGVGKLAVGWIIQGGGLRPLTAFDGVARRDRGAGIERDHRRRGDIACFA